MKSTTISFRVFDSEKSAIQKEAKKKKYNSASEFIAETIRIFYKKTPRKKIIKSS